MTQPPKPNYVIHCPLCGWPQGQPWLTVGQASLSLAISPRKTRTLINTGMFNQVVKVANEWRIHHEALDRYIAENQELIGLHKKNSREK